MTISIWGEYRGKAEVIDRASSVREAQYLAGEYQLAYGKDWRVWAGKRDGSLPEKKQRVSYGEHKRQQQAQAGHWTASM